MENEGGRGKGENGKKKGEGKSFAMESQAFAKRGPIMEDDGKTTTTHPMFVVRWGPGPFMIETSGCNWKWGDEGRRIEKKGGVGGNRVFVKATQSAHSVHIRKDGYGVWTSG